MVAVSTVVGPLLVTQRDDRIEPCRTLCRVDAEDEADGGRERERDGDGRRGDEDRPAGEPADQDRGADAEDRPEDAARYAQHDGLDEELEQDVPRLRADREADADLPRALR